MKLGTLLHIPYFATHLHRADDFHSDVFHRHSTVESRNSHPLAAYLQQLSLAEPIIKVGTMSETWSGMIAILQDADEFLADPGNWENVSEKLNFRKKRRTWRSMNSRNS